MQHDRLGIRTDLAVAACNAPRRGRSRHCGGMGGSRMTPAYTSIGPGAAALSPRIRVGVHPPLLHEDVHLLGNGRDDPRGWSGRHGQPGVGTTAPSMSGSTKVRTAGSR